MEIVYTYPSISQLLRNWLFLHRSSDETLPAIFASRDIHHQRGFTLSRVKAERNTGLSDIQNDDVGRPITKHAGLRPAGCICDR